MEGEFELEIVSRPLPKALGLTCKPGSSLDMEGYGRSPKRTLVERLHSGKEWSKFSGGAYSW